MVKRFRDIVILALCWLCLAPLQAAQWTTIFAYNNVTQIALGADCVYALSDGSLFSVDKQSERIRTYDRQSGLHGMEISCIHYDEHSAELIIAYQSGKIDILSSKGVHYVGELYEKDMTQRKTIYNITIHGRTAYFATHYGVQTFDLRNNHLVDSYWLRPRGEETPINDVLIQGDSIYAFSTDSMFSAALSDRLVDYTVWRRELRSGRISPDNEKGIHCVDGNEHWYAGGSEGVIRFTATERLTYKPQGPLVNYCYRIRHTGGKTGIVPGGYDVGFYNRTGMVMTYEEGKWKNYDGAYMQSHLNMSNTTDYSDIAIDPKNTSHFFVASFGYGLIEFRDNEFYKQYIPSNSPLEPVCNGCGLKYIWVDGLNLDADGNLWMCNNSDNGVKVLMADGTWATFSNAACMNLNRSKDLLISNTNRNIKMISCRSAGIGVFDDKGTIKDTSDDEAVFVDKFVDSATGESIIPSVVRTIFQTSDGAVCVAETIAGLLRIARPEQLLAGDNRCEVIHLNIESEGREDVFSNEDILCFAEDNERRIWIGTKKSGLYCVSSDWSQILYHFTTDNTPLLSNDIQSLCYVKGQQLLYIGTGGGLHTFTFNDKSDIDYADRLQDESELYSYGNMKRWRTHFSYNTVSAIEDAANQLYCVANGSLAVVDKETEEIAPLNKLTGLNGTEVQLVSYNAETGKTLIVYKNGLIDIIYPDGSVKNMPDVFLKTEIQSAEFYRAFSYKNHVYICSSIGIIAVNMRRNEITETYLLRKDEKDVDIHHLCVVTDSLFAASGTDIFTASQTDNLLDYSVWRPLSVPFDGDIVSIGAVDRTLYVQVDSALYQYKAGVWSQLKADKKWRALYVHPNQLFGRTDDSLYAVTAGSLKPVPLSYTPNDLLQSGQDYWIALAEDGIVKWNSAEGTQQFTINSPFENLSYRIRICGDKLIMLPGGYFTVSYQRLANVMMYENGFWSNYTYRDLQQATGGNTYYEFCDAAIDPDDPSHFFIASFGYGLLEFKNNAFYQWFIPGNTPNGLEAVNEPEWAFTWVDGLSFDADGNLWMLNNSQNGVKVRLKNGTWVRYGNKATRDLNRSKDLLIWNQDSHIKIVTCARSNTGVGVFDDNGTITYTGDDKAAFFSSFVDQNGKTVKPDFIYSICQMANGEVWVGTERGLIVIPDVRKLLNNDNHCRRIIIPRNDGTGLGDYLLADEQINAIVEDAAGRKWIGTENSGLYLMSEDGLETFEHFTYHNSPLTSNGIYALAIHPVSGELFIGTGMGLLSYQSDANAPQENLSDIYAYPNPVAQNYAGYISITGLMENTVVNIVDEGGNLVCKTRSNGGIAIWDGKDASGKRVCPGIYTALCNAGQAHSVCKILILHETR